MSVEDDVILGGTPGDQAPSLVLASERVLVEGELQPAVLSVRDGRIHQVWWGSADPARVGLAGDAVLLGDKVVLPGVVDTHVHVNEPGRTAWEGFASATRAAVLGGTTTIVDMPLNSIPPTTTVAGLAAKRAAAEAVRARGELHCDVGFWGGAVPGNGDDLEPLWDAGVLGFKCFLADSGVPEFPPLGPAELLDTMDRIARFGGLLVVHAEDPAALAAAPHAGSRAYADFLLSRPDEAETTAIAGLLDAVRETGARTHVLHVSSARALDLIAEAKDEGLPVTAETCHHYLVLDSEHIPDGDAAFTCCPPIRDRANQDALWDGLRDGILDCVVSDHSPATAEEKYRGAVPGEADLQQAWGGISGLQAGFLALAAAARGRGVPLTDVSRWTSANTAALVGLDRGSRPKGVIAEGAAADLLVYDPDATTTFRAPEMAHKNKISAYDGLTVTGAVVECGLFAGSERFDTADSQHSAASGVLLRRPA